VPGYGATTSAQDKAQIAKLQSELKDLLDQEAGIKESESTLNSAIDRLLTGCIWAARRWCRARTCWC
jgi:hypothetical protein